MSKYKYRLNHRLSLLPKGVYLENVVEQLEREYGIKALQFNHDRFIATESEEEIPSDRLSVYADIFSVETKALLSVNLVANPS